ncbi:MAG: hypothetical protein GY849_07635 [Deltaproteobacteria bacterium]|nr:hypothetical protein [Deltaproteobacteria bacterium]
MQLHHVAVVCRSEELADRFYGGILGLKRIKSSLLQKELAGLIFDMALECPFMLYGNETLFVEVFVPGRVQEKLASFEHMCLEVEDREKLLSKCRAAGLRVKEIPKGDSLLTFIADFDGNLFEIKGIKK